MKKLVAVLGCLMVLSLLVNLAHAVEPASQELKAQDFSLTNKHSEKQSESTHLKTVVLNNKSLGSKFLLNQNFSSCMKQCDSQFESCMSQAGDDASGQFRCGEKRFMCARGCDNQYYSQLKF